MNDASLGDLSQPVKLDRDKNRVDLLPVDALQEVGEVLTFGAKKYEEGNWARGEGFKWSRLYRPALNHMWEWVKGNDKDPESGRHHLAHATCCLLFLLSHIIRGKGKDDRKDIGQM